MCSFCGTKIFLAQELMLNESSLNLYSGHKALLLGLHSWDLGKNRGFLRFFKLIMGAVWFFEATD